LLIPNEHFWQGFSSPYFALVYVSNDKRTVSISGFFFLSEGAFDTEVIRHRQSLAQAVCLQFSTTSIVWELLALWNSLRSATLTVDMGPFYSLFRDDTRKQYDLSFPSYFLTAPVFVLNTLFHIHLFCFHWLTFHAPYHARILQPFISLCLCVHKKNYCVNKLWPKRTSLTSGEKNIINPPLVLPEKIHLPPLRIKLGLMKNFAKCMDKTGRGI